MKTDGAKTLKGMLQSWIDSGRVHSYEMLMALVKEAGYTITRNGKSYLGLMTEDGKRFRVRFQFENTGRPEDCPVERKPRTCRIKAPEKKSKTPQLVAGESGGRWVYAVIAVAGNERACYVGQTGNLKKRFGTHLRGMREGRGSHDLHRWAEQRGAPLLGVVLSFMRAPESVVTELEGYWLRLAIRAGYDAVAWERWGRLPAVVHRDLGQPTEWDDSTILAVALPLQEMVAANELRGSLYPVR